MEGWPLLKFSVYSEYGVRVKWRHCLAHPITRSYFQRREEQTSDEQIILLQSVVARLVGARMQRTSINIRS